MNSMAVGMMPPPVMISGTAAMASSARLEEHQQVHRAPGSGHQPQGDLREDAQRALAADQQAG